MSNTENELIECSKIERFMAAFEYRLQMNPLTDESWKPRTREFLRGPVPGILATKEPLFQAELCILAKFI
jgi:hypothetical protein